MKSIATDGTRRLPVYGEQSRYVRRLAAPLIRWCRADELAELAFPMWSAYGLPCEALRSRDPGQVTP